MRRICLRTLGLGLGLALAAPALAQDADNDGAPDASDAFPCDPTLASVTYAPAQNTWSLLGFEDQWPGHTDLDFNDVLLNAHYRIYGDGQGNTVRVVAIFDPVALGGDFSNGLALQLPVPASAVTMNRRVGGGAWAPVVAQGDAQATWILSDDLRELFGGQAGPINSIPNDPIASGQRLELDIAFTGNVTLDAAQAPFDVFVFRAGDFGHQIHFPRYAGTAAMTGALFNTGTDASNPSRKFVHFSGVPFALDLGEAGFYPSEGTDISRLYPDITTYAGSGGTQAQDYYASNVQSGHGISVTRASLPAEPGIDQSCVFGSQVFAYTGSDQTFVVPPLVTSVQVRTWGAGGGGSRAGEGRGGGGAFVHTRVAVTPGETLTVIVGQGGRKHASTSGTVLSPGTYGGGGGGHSTYSHDNTWNGVRRYRYSITIGEGGGRSAIRRGGTELVTAAGGGGGADDNACYGSTSRNLRADGGAGGIGSGQWGANGYEGSRANRRNGKGGTTSNNGAGPGGSGGAGGANGSYPSYPTRGEGGSLFQGGRGSSFGGAGGGGGYYGGGGSAPFDCSGGAAGGSSYYGGAGVSLISSAGGSRMTPGGTGDLQYAPGVATGGDDGAGGNGRIVISWP